MASWNSWIRSRPRLNFWTGQISILTRAQTNTGHTPITFQTVNAHCCKMTGTEFGNLWVILCLSHTTSLKRQKLIAGTKIMFSCSPRPRWLWHLYSSLKLQYLQSELLFCPAKMDETFLNKPPFFLVWSEVWWWSELLNVRQFQTSEKMTPALFLKAQTHVM